MLKSLMCSLVLLVAVTTQANANLIKVFFDPLSQNSPTPTQVYNADGFVIN